MMQTPTRYSSPPGLTPPLVPLAAAGLAVAPVLVALASQYWGGLAPCVLCHWQRYALLATGALALLAAALPVRLRPAAMVLVVLGFLVTAGIAAFHVGVEQKWWEGTSACVGAIDPNATLEQLRQQIIGAPVTRCDDVAWSLLGISLAGYNFFYALTMALLVTTWLTRLGVQKKP